MTRGYFGIGIYDPKTGANIGSLMRSAYAFGADFTFTVKGEKGLFRHPTNTVRSERHLPHYEYNDLEHFMALMPVEKTLVGIDANEGVPLTTFAHPERAIYLLGREDGGLPPELVPDVRVNIPTRYCLNVAAAGAIILYDRTTKRRTP